MNQKTLKKPTKASKLATSIVTGELKNKTMIVLNFIIEHPNTNIHVIRKELRLPHQTVTSSLSVLMDEGVVEAVSQIEINDLIYSVLLYTNDPVKINKLKLQREREKLVIWAKRGLKDFSDHMDLFLKNELEIIVTTHS